MCKGLVRSILSRSPFLQKLVFKLERWMREDLYSAMSHERFKHFLNLLAPDVTGGICFSRKGSINDGGYVFCDFQKKYSKLISFGVGDNVDFERDISDLVDSIDLYDPSVDKLPCKIENATFHKVGLGQEFGNGFLTLYDATKSSLPDDQLLLKIDIEGGEWDSIVTTDSKVLENFSQIFLELHDLHKVCDPIILSKYIAALEKLRLNHELVNIHANNWSAYSVIQGVPLPDTIEITLLRRSDHPKKRNSQDSNVKEFNSPNNPKMPEYRLIF